MPVDLLISSPLPTLGVTEIRCMPDEEGAVGHLPDTRDPAMLVLGEYTASKVEHKVKTFTEMASCRADGWGSMTLTEMRHVCRIAHAFRRYKTDADWEVTRWESNYLRLSQRHK